jgi:hypothetical protein
MRSADALPLKAHTFAVELLLAGVPIERVSVLLGHQSLFHMHAEMRLFCQIDREPSLTCPCQSAWNVSYRSPFSFLH